MDSAASPQTPWAASTVVSVLRRYAPVLLIPALAVVLALGTVTPPDPAPHQSSAVPTVPAFGPSWIAQLEADVQIELARIMEEDRVAAEAAEQERLAEEARQRAAAQRAQAPRTFVAASCDLNTSPVPNSIVQCESKCDPRAQNPGSTASGLFQVLNSTWDGYGGYARAADAPVEVQNRWAAEAYAARGSAPWASCGG